MQGADALIADHLDQLQVGPYIASLDRMYDYMCQLYGVPRDHKVWLGGKALIFAFLEKEQFDAFESVIGEFMQAPYPAWTAVGTTGLLSDGGIVEVQLIARVK